MNDVFFFFFYQYEPLIEKKNIDYIHHIVITTCPDVIEADVGTSFECYHHHTPRRFQTCSEALVAWAVGGVVSMMYMYIIDILLPWNNTVSPPVCKFSSH